MVSSDLKLTMMSLVCGTLTAVLVASGAWIYLRRVRMERPAIGVFNRRDVAVLFVLLCTIPALYLNLPRWLLTTFLGITFFSAVSIGLRPLLRPATVWLTVGFLLGLNIWLGNNALGTVRGWQIYWAEDSLIVLLAAIAVSNLYVQGGMQLRHVAWFAGALAIYDVVFTEVWPLTRRWAGGSGSTTPRSVSATCWSTRCSRSPRSRRTGRRRGASRSRWSSCSARSCRRSSRWSSTT
jgi:hypothetical protein